MAPPLPKNCYIDGCEFTTSAGLPNYEMLMRDLELHIKCVHKDVTSSVGIEGSKNSVISKPDRLPRPTVGEDITEADWLHFP